MKAQTDCDYIIIGAGLDGCVLAARLTEAPAIRVLLIEAGPISSVPLIDEAQRSPALLMRAGIGPAEHLAVIGRDEP